MNPYFYGCSKIEEHFTFEEIVQYNYGLGNIGEWILLDWLAGLMD